MGYKLKSNEAKIYFKNFFLRWNKLKERGLYKAEIEIAKKKKVEKEKTNHKE